MLCLAILGTLGRRPPANLLAALLAVYCLWLAVEAAFLTPRYSSESVYRPLILLSAFGAVALLTRHSASRLFRAGAGLLAVLVLIGLLQFYFGFWHLAHNPQRAAAIFVTPNTFATAINLFLVPLVALYVTGRGGVSAYVCALWIFAGLLATESRGGYLGLIVGCLFLAAYTGVPRLRANWMPWLKMLAGLLAVLIAFVLAVAAMDAPPELEPFGSTIVTRGSSLRIELAAIAISHILERPIAGYGANMFLPLFEMSKPPELDVPSSYLFVHNDYLQVWLEFGLPGLALLVAVFVCAIVPVWAARRSAVGDPLPLACGAALVTVFVHALVDFPLYVPFLLAVIGGYLGALSAWRGNDPLLNSLVTNANARIQALATPLIKAVLTAVALVWLGQPLLADLASHVALGELTAGRTANAIYWQSVARRLEPRDSLHWWGEAVTWRDQAVEARNREFAARADALFAEAARVGPYEPLYLFERARLHRRHADLLERAASAEQIVSWTKRALELRPYSIQAQAEHARALAYADRPAEAKKVAQAIVDRHPDSEIALRLASDLGL